MRKLSLIYLLLSLLTVANAQVTIGSDKNPVTGAILDLKQEHTVHGEPNANKGLLLPRVKLIDKNNLYPMFDLGEAGIPNMNYDSSAKKNTQDLQHAGLLVFNVNDKPEIGLCKGIYVWNKSEWTKLGEECEVPGALALDKTQERILTTGELQLNAIYTPIDASISWATDDHTIATVDSNGKVTTLSEGNVMITATINYGADKKMSATCALEVKDLKISILNPNPYVLLGDNLQLTANISPTWVETTVLWDRITGTSANIASNTGVVAPVAPIANTEGEATTFRATATAGTIKATATTIVNAAELRATIKTSRTKLLSGMTEKLTANITPSWASTIPNKDLTYSWTSLSPTFLTLTGATATTPTITPAEDISNTYGEFVNVELEVSSGEATAIATPTRFNVGTLKLIFSKTVKGLVIQDERTNKDSSSFYNATAFSPFWAKEIVDVAVKIESDNEAIAKQIDNNTIVATTSFPGDGPTTTHKKATFSAKATVTVKETGQVWSVEAPEKCVIKVYSANPFQFVDKRPGVADVTYWASYYGNSVYLDSYTQEPIWSGHWMMAENLRALHLPDGTAIARYKDYSEGNTSSSITPIYEYPDLDPSRLLDGVLYNFPAIMARTLTGSEQSPESPVQGICPDGWVLPIDGSMISNILFSLSVNGDNATTYGIASEGLVADYVYSSSRYTGRMSKPKEKGGFDAIAVGGYQNSAALTEPSPKHNNLTRYSNNYWATSKISSTNGLDNSTSYIAGMSASSENSTVTTGNRYMDLKPVRCVKIK